MNNTTIPLPDADAIARCIIQRAIPALDRKAIPFLFLKWFRAICWAIDAITIDAELFLFTWPDGAHCFALLPELPEHTSLNLTPQALIAAYRHALEDPLAYRLFDAKSYDRGVMH